MALKQFFAQTSGVFLEAKKHNMLRVKACNSMLLGFVLFSSTLFSGATARLTIDAADGSLLDTETGAPFVARGMNWGSRLTPGANGTSLYNESDVTTAQKLLPGMNYVRLVLDYYSGGICFTDIYSEAAETTGWISPNWLAYIDNAVRWTAAADVKLTITLRNNIGTASPHGTTTSKIPCDADYISNATARNRWFDTWRFIAKRYLNESNIAWYEPASEPHLIHKAPLANGTWVDCHSMPEVKELFNSVVKVIREVDSDTLIAVAPHGYESCPGLSSLDKLDDDKLVYALNWPCQLAKSPVNYHGTGTCASLGSKSEFSTCIPACAGADADAPEDDNATFTYDRSVVKALLAPALAFTSQHNVPLWIDQAFCPPGSFQNSHAWLADTMSELGGLSKTSFSWWTWKAADEFGDKSSQAILTLRKGASKHTDKQDLAAYVLNEEVYALYKAAFV